MDDARGTGLRRRSLLALGVLTLLVGACGIGDKATLEERITGAPERFGSQQVRGTISVESRFLAAPDGVGFGMPALPGGEALDIPEDGIVLRSERGSFSLDMEASRAALTSEGTSGPAVVMEDLVYFGRRAGIPADDARPWVRLDLAEVAEGAGEVRPFDEDATGAIVSLHPAIVIDLAAGALTGSIETVGAEMIHGIEVTHYEMNIAVDKALRDVRRSRYPEERREQVELLIELLGVDGDVHPADVWLDGDGLIRRFSVRLAQRPRTKVEFALVVTVEVTAIGGAYEATPPTPQEVLSVDSVVRFIRTVSGGSSGDGGGT